MATGIEDDVPIIMDESEGEDDSEGEGEEDSESEGEEDSEGEGESDIEGGSEEDSDIKAGQASSEANGNPEVNEARKSLLEHLMQYRYVVLDEAGAMLEPDVVGTLLHGCRFLLLVGDPRQVCPACLMPTAPVPRTMSCLPATAPVPGTMQLCEECCMTTLRGSLEGYACLGQQSKLCLHCTEE
jgi:hypothetical protein